MACPAPQKLQQLLDESLAAEESKPLQTHLESCAACQKTLERLAAGGVTWDKTAENLAQGAIADDPALLETVAKLQDPSKNAEPTLGATSLPPHDENLLFLQPSSKPGSLGRLDKYEILAVLGKGGFGIVLKAFDESLHRVVAIKVLSPQMAH